MKKQATEIPSGTTIADSSTDFSGYMPRRTLDEDLVDFMYNEDVKKKNDENGKQFFDNSMTTQALINAIGSPMPLAHNRRKITWNIPRLDLIWRSNPYVKRAIRWISSKALIKGIDISSQDDRVTSKEIGLTQESLKKQYRPFKRMLELGLAYGGSAGLVVLKDKHSKEDYKNPLNINTVRKGDFEGIKALARWYQIEPALDKGLVQEIGEEYGITDPDLLGQPLYYRVNLSGGLSGFSGLSRDKPLGETMLVHRSWLLLFNPHSLSHIETQIERYWSSSIIETASVDLERHEMLWSATAKSAIKNNLGTLKINGLGNTVMNSHSKKLVNSKIELIKETTNHGIVALDAKDDFKFESSNLTGNEKALEQSMKQLANALSAPVNVLFPDIVNFDEDSYNQSLYEVEDMQDMELRPMYERLVPIIYRHLFGKKINHFKFNFNPIMTLSQYRKSEVMKNMMEVVDQAYQDGFIAQKDGIKMLADLIDNPSNIFHNISKDYIDQVERGDENGDIITSNTFKIELAKALNQFQNEQNGLSGVEQPESSTEGKEKGGDPTKSKRLFKRNPLNREKAKE
jgi:hypothetical protein